MKIKVDGARLALYTRQLAVLVRCGVPLPQSFRSLARGDDPILNLTSSQVADQIETGMYISAACGQHPHVFPIYYLGLLQVGEASGTLSQLLEELARHLDRSDRVSKKVRQALTYPLVLCVTCLALLLFLIAYILPLMAPLFEQAGAPLPLLTRACLWLATALGRPESWAGLALLGGLGYLLFVQVQEAEINSPLRRSRDSFLLGLPLLGQLLRWTILAQLFKLTGLMAGAGVEIRLIISTVYRCISYQEYREALLDVEDALMEGGSLAEALEVSPLFPPGAIQMVTVAEETGRLPQMLRIAAELYEDQAETLTGTLVDLLEPLLLCAASLLVGTVCVAVLLPWMSLLSHLG